MNDLQALVGAVVIATLLATVGIDAQSPYSETFDKCQETAQSTREIRECYKAERAAWEKRLTIAYQAMLTKFANEDKDLPLGEPFKLGTTRVGLLRAAERAWIAFRAADCLSLSSVEGGGSMGGILYDQCELDHVAERAALLEELGKDEP